MNPKDSVVCHIEKREASDVPAELLREMAEIFIPCFSLPPRREVWNEKEATDYIREVLKGKGWVFLASNESVLLGFALACPALNANIGGDFPSGTNPETGDYLSVIAVRPENRSQGVGGKLLKSVVEDSRSRGIKSLLARTRSDDAASTIKFMLGRLGFHVAKRYTAEIGGEIAEREIHHLALSEAPEDWKALDVYCLQTIALPSKAAEKLLVCGRSILRGIKRRSDQRHMTEDWRWDGWRLLSDDARTASEDWAMLVRHEMPGLACSVECCMDGVLHGLLVESVAKIPCLSKEQGVWFDAPGTEILLCVNEHGSFLLLVRFRLRLAPELAGDQSGSILLSDRLFETIRREDRGVLELLQSSSWGLALKDRVNTVVRSLCERWLRNGWIQHPLAGVRWNPEERYEPKTVHTISIYEGGVTRGQMESVHRIEEFPQDGGIAAIIAEERNEVFFQLGWSFSSFGSLGRRESLMVMRIIVELQMAWWFMRDCRNYLYRLGGAANDPEISSKGVAQAADDALAVESSFNKFLIDHKRFRAAISPRDQLIFDEMETKWKMKDDFALVRDMNEDLRRAAQVRSSKVSEGVQQRFGFILFVVAIIQMFSMIGTIKDYRDMMFIIEDKQPHRGFFAAFSDHGVRFLEEHVLEVVGSVALTLILLPFLPQIFGYLSARTTALLLWAEWLATRRRR
jgi:GNAT superfamily N-acetyltransferase